MLRAIAILLFASYASSTFSVEIKKLPYCKFEFNNGTALFEKGATKGRWDYNGPGGSPGILTRAPGKSEISWHNPGSGRSGAATLPDACMNP